MIFHDVQQNTEEWEALRIGKATASNFGKFMANDGKAFGDPAKRYALQLALERVTGRKAEYSFRNDDMDRGHEQEPLARMLYEEQQFVDVDNGGFFDHGEHGDSPDGLVSTDGVVEIKSVIASTHEANIRRRAHDPAYHWQIVGHIDCTGREWVDFVSYCADYPEWAQLCIYRIYRADVASDIARLAERRAKFLELVQVKVNEIEQKEAA